MNVQMKQIFQESCMTAFNKLLYTFHVLAFCVLPKINMCTFIVNSALCRHFERFQRIVNKTKHFSSVSDSFPKISSGICMRKKNHLFMRKYAKKLENLKQVKFDENPKTLLLGFFSFLQIFK